MLPEGEGREGAQQNIFLVNFKYFQVYLFHNGKCTQEFPSSNS
jgi:hypothetical protein